MTGKTFVIHTIHKEGVHSLTLERANRDDGHRWEIVYYDFDGWVTRGRPALKNGKLSIGALAAIKAYGEASGAAFGTLDKIQSEVRRIQGVKGSVKVPKRRAKKR